MKRIHLPVVLGGLFAFSVPVSKSHCEGVTPVIRIKPDTNTVHTVLPNTTDSISQYGITWHFGKLHEFGTFANGDYWVSGDTVVITRITPNFDGTKHGWEVNPIVDGSQGFADDLGDFNPKLVPTLPYKALPGQSLVKSIRSDRPRSGGNCFECLKTASVLTILRVPPADFGATVFRLPYVGTEKPQYSVKSIRWERLPKLAPVGHAPTLSWVQTSFERVQLDHKAGSVGRNVHPYENIPDYGADIGRRNADAALRLMLSDSDSLKRRPLIAYLQYGIDLYQMLSYGQTWPFGGGHRPGQKLPLVFTAIMLGDEAMAGKIKAASFFHEDRGVKNTSASQRALYGFDTGLSPFKHEQRYWEVVVSDLRTGKPSGYKAYADPYGFIDGGNKPGHSYQICCTAQPWKGSALALHLMPELKTIWNTPEFFEYVDRWVSFGAWSQPDPCAPSDTIAGHYGVTYGPDGKGGCIRDCDSSDGIGRFPNAHGLYADGGGSYSVFQNEMWKKYRSLNLRNSYLEGDFKSRQGPP